jgi:GT2 family glycosyltransferase
VSTAIHTATTGTAEPRLINVSAIVPTAGRATFLRRALESLAAQTLHPIEIIIVDASQGSEPAQLCDQGIPGLRSQIRWVIAKEHGAAAQRNQGVATATQEVIWFFDDDIVYKPNCVESLWNAISSDRQLGGVNAMIINQRYQPPGLVSRVLFLLMHGQREKSFAGKVIGPAINLLPEDRHDLPEIVPVEWLNTTCTMYRRDALPSSPFDSFFSGYSLMEDLALSLRVGERGWKLANVRTARVFHDSQSGGHKTDLAAIASMELQNRHYVMTKILRRTSISDYVKLSTWELFSIITSGRKNIRYLLTGKWHALRELYRSKTN